jgi:DNA-binding NarL/FixJ family response regulator
VTPSMETKRSQGPSSFAPDVIILDLVMPRMKGLKAAESIRTVLPAAPIVINTLYRTPQVEVEAKKHGIRKVVDKGNAGALISAVEELRIAGRCLAPPRGLSRCGAGSRKSVNPL